MSGLLNVDPRAVDRVLEIEALPPVRHGGVDVSRASTALDVIPKACESRGGWAPPAARRRSGSPTDPGSRAGEPWLPFRRGCWACAASTVAPRARIMQAAAYRPFTTYNLSSHCLGHGELLALWIFFCSTSLRNKGSSSSFGVARYLRLESKLFFRGLWRFSAVLRSLRLSHSPPKPLIRQSIARYNEGTTRYSAFSLTVLGRPLEYRSAKRHAEARPGSRQARKR